LNRAIIAWSVIVGIVVMLSTSIIPTSYGGEDLNNVLIDIKPGSDPNSINPESRGVIPVAILGSNTFDAADVDVSTLVFGPGLAVPLHQNALHLEDVNNDGFTDLVTHYRTQETGIISVTTEACLLGQTNGGEIIGGCDAIITNPA